MALVMLASRGCQTPWPWHTCIHCVKGTLQDSFHNVQNIPNSTVEVVPKGDSGVKRERGSFQTSFVYTPAAVRP